MRKIVLFYLVLVSFFVVVFSTYAFAQEINHTAREEAEGKSIWKKLQLKQLQCKNLSDAQYDSLGEYFMGQSIGNTERHEAMNQMMVSMMGKEGEKQIHIVIGKRLSGCGSNTETRGGGNSMMGYGGWSGFGLVGWFSMLISWMFLVLGVVALIRYLTHSGQSREGKTPLDVLKERYARGEINKKEYEEKKKDLA